MKGIIKRIDDIANDKSPLRFIVEGTAYFLSGIFVLTIMIVHISGNDVSIGIPNSNVVIAIGSYLTVFIGSVLTLTGFVYLFAELREKLKNTLLKYQKWLFAFLFATTSTQVIKVIFELWNWNIKPLFFVSIAFAVLLCIVVIAKSRLVFWNVGQLIAMGIAILVMGIFSIFKPEPTEIRWDLLIIFLITLLLLLRAFVMYKRKNEDDHADEPNN